MHLGKYVVGAVYSVGAVRCGVVCVHVCVCMCVKTTSLHRPVS